MNLRRRFRLPFCAVAALLLASCAQHGAPPTVPGTNAVVPSSQSVTSSLAAIRRAGPGTQQGLMWNPPTLKFTESRPQSSTVLDPNGYPDAAATLTGDTCSARHIATIASFAYGIWTVTPGKKRATCTFTVTDKTLPGSPSGTLNVTNDTGGPPHLTWNPPSLTFEDSSPKSSTVLDTFGNPDPAATLSGDTCSGAGIAKIKAFDYGIWNVTPGKKNGTCSFTVTDNTLAGSPSATLIVTNDANHHPKLIWNPPVLTFDEHASETSTVFFLGKPDVAATITGNTCSNIRIATIKPSNGGVWAIMPGNTNGTCSFTATDYSRPSNPRGILTVTNNSGHRRVHLMWNPNPLTFTDSAPRASTVSDALGDADPNAIVTGDTCGRRGIATISRFGYGVWVVTPGNMNGSCFFTATDYASPGIPKGALRIANQAH